MPDYEAMFLSTAQETAELMSKRDKQPRTWDCDGQSVTGWAIDTDHSASKDGGEGWWEEYWSNTAYILTTDGTFWEYRSSTSKYSYQATEQSATLRPLDTSYFVGREGKPFSRWRSKLERLPYQ